MSDNIEYHRHRYILMRHAANGDNLAYLYAHSRVIEAVGKGETAVDIVQVRGEDGKHAEYLAKYQLGRLQSGYEARYDEVFEHYQDALAVALAASDITLRYPHSK